MPAKRVCSNFLQKLRALCGSVQIGLYEGAWQLSHAEILSFLGKQEVPILFEIRQNNAGIVKESSELLSSTNLPKK